MKPDFATRLLTCLSLFSLLLGGCGGGKTKMDTTAFEQAFASAAPSIKGPADEAARALKSEKYVDGATALANLAKSAESMTEEQKQAMNEVGITIQVILSEGGDEISDPMKVWQALEDMFAALEGRESATVGSDPDRVRPPVVPVE
jgi:hypothetical protein